MWGKNVIKNCDHEKYQILFLEKTSIQTFGEKNIEFFKSIVL